LGGKTIETPKRALHLTPERLCESSVIALQKGRGLNEIYRTIDKDDLTRISSDTKAQEHFNAQMQAALSKVSGEEINFVFYAFDNASRTEETPRRLPDKKQTEYLADLAYSFGDAVIPPVLVGQSARDYLTFLKNYFQTVKGLDDKPIFGLIPYCSHLELRPLLDFYRKSGIHLFAMNLLGRHPTLLLQNIVMTLRTMRRIQTDSGEDCYLHGLNVGFGRALPQHPVAPAKDVMSWLAGFDSFGGSHVPLKVRPDLLPFRGTRPAVRLFVRRNYGYYRSDFSPMEEEGGDRFSVSLSDVRQALTYSLTRKLQRAYNAERQAVEAESLASAINGGTSLKVILSSKEHVQNELKKVSRMVEDLSIPTLD
jgi:hypothetical protein